MENWDDLPEFEQTLADGGKVNFEERKKKHTVESNALQEQVKASKLELQMAEQLMGTAKKKIKNNCRMSKVPTETTPRDEERA